MPKFFNPNGNPEIWEHKPNGYFTEDEWNALHPAEAEENTQEDITPTELDRISAQVMYTAMMTDTLLDEV